MGKNMVENAENVENVKTEVKAPEPEVMDERDTFALAYMVGHTAHPTRSAGASSAYSYADAVLAQWAHFSKQVKPWERDLLASFAAGILAGWAAKPGNTNMNPENIWTHAVSMVKERKKPFSPKV